MDKMAKVDAVEYISDSIEKLIDVKIAINEGQNRYSELYQRRADLKEAIALLVGVEIL